MKQGFKQPQGKQGGNGSKTALREKPNFNKALWDSSQGLNPKQNPRKCVRWLLDIVDDPDANSNSRRSAFNEIISIGREFSIREEVVSELMDDVEKGHNCKAALALGHLKAVEAIDVLRGALQYDHDITLNLPKNAATALEQIIGSIGEKGEDAMLELVKMFSDEWLAGWAADALAKTGEKAVPFLVKELSEGKKLLAAKALGKMGRKAQSAFPALEKRTKWWREWDGDVRKAAREAIENIQKDIIMNSEG